MADPWDIPDPCHFESCSPVPCGPCDAGNIFQYPQPSYGVPVGRVVVPLVRVNGQVQDLNAGGFIPNQFVEPPQMSWNAQTGTLNIGGRFLKLTGLNAMYSDCKGQTISPCTPVMTCANFAEIINASSGVGFKTPSNPFAGLTIIVKNGSGLTIDNAGLGLDYAVICQKLKDIGCSIGGGTPTPPTVSPTPPTVSPTPPTVSPTPPTVSPNPPTPPTSYSRSGIPGYSCHNSANTVLETNIGSFTLTWTQSAGFGSGTVTVSPAGPTLFYSGSEGAASLISSPMLLSQFNSITMVAIDTVCSGSPTPPTPPTVTPTPPTPPTPSTDPKSIPSGGCADGQPVSISWSAGVMTYTITATGLQTGTVNFRNSGGGVVVSATPDFCANSGLPTTATVPVTDSQYALIASVTINSCTSCN